MKTHIFFWTIVAAASLLPPIAVSGPGADPAGGWRGQIEADWELQQSVRGLPGRQAQVTPEEDAAGGCDGVKDGRWGFHTAEEENPWWQVDLGSAEAIERVAIFNRCDGTAGRAARLAILLSSDGASWREVYRHGGNVFLGAPDGKPLGVLLGGAPARFVRIQLPGRVYLHLDEVEVYAAGDRAGNLALGRPCSQSSTSPWSSRKRSALKIAAGSGSQEALGARWAARAQALASALLDFEDLLFIKRVPGIYSHMSDQNYGWWSRPGGGIYLLKGFKTAAPEPLLLTGALPPGSISSIDLSYDVRRILFSYCKHYPQVAGIANKVDKERLPEDGFYHIFEMAVDGTGLRQLTHGRYDDFDARYLPDGDLVFLSTRRGKVSRCVGGSQSQSDPRALPDSYVRCGGDEYRPVAVYTLHRMGPGGEGIRALSPFENFEWNPSVASDGRILYARWDYVDRNNGPFMSLWSMNPDGANIRAVYGNFTVTPYSIFEARSVPGSNKIVFTASAHHSITGGSLVLLDPSRGIDGLKPLQRLTPEVCFPEGEGWPSSYYASPYPLSEWCYLTAWSPEPVVTEGRPNPPNALGLYLFDARSGQLELLYRDPMISSLRPIPLRPLEKPPALTSAIAAADMEAEGRLILLDVYDGLEGLERGTVKSLRIVGIPPKTQPRINTPVLGLTGEDPGKCVLGTIPVEEDGSAYFRVPAGMPLFFQALEARGLAVQTMRSATSVQPGETLACAGCHEPRTSAPRNALPLATRRDPSLIIPGPEGSWPLRFDVLVQPVLDKHCAVCHQPGGPDAAAKFDLTALCSYENLVAFGKPSLRDQVKMAHQLGRSIPGACGARASPVLKLLEGGGPHPAVSLDEDSFNRLATWMDTYGQKLGSFSPEQEEELRQFRLQVAGLLAR
ncbi:MAG: discoidin domain-containing protein [Planctomycetes bacterium]|nr:discoidin domain-containing protein [Planctomycetota bacterium]